MDVDDKKIIKFSKSEKKSIEQFYVDKYNYIFDVIKNFPRKNSVDEEGDYEVLRERQIDPNKLPERLCPGLYNEKKRAKTLEDLQAKIAALKGKNKLSYKEKIGKKVLKNRLKKKDKKEKRKQSKSASKAIASFERKKARREMKKPKPVYNNGELIFSKFDFSESGAKGKKSQYKTPKDPEVALRKLREEDQKLKTLKEAGESELVQKIVVKKAWKAAFMKSEGVHVKDDPELLKQAIRKKKQKKEKSIKKWDERQEKVKKFKEDRQRKRTENIQARSEAKKANKMKKAAKRGRIGKITAGF